MNGILDRQVVSLLTQAVTQHQAGALAEAKQLYQRVLQMHPRQADALHLLGVIAHQTGETARAIELIQQAIQIDGQRWAFHSNLACALGEQKRHQEAIASYRRAIELGGESAPLLSNLGAAYQDAGQRAEAEGAYTRAIALDPQNAEAHYNLGNLLRESGHTQRAMECYEQALRLKPNYAQAHVNLANLLQDQRQYHEAVRSYRWALELNDQDAETHYNLARALKALGNHGEALAAYERAIQLKPDHASAHMLRGLILLRQGRFSEGWPEYDFRWQKADEPDLRNLPQPLWIGQSLAGKTVLVYSEQGVGDEIMFASCLPDVIAQAGHCIIECDPRLVGLYRRSFPTATVQPRLGWDDHSWLAQMRPIDFQVPIGNLARFTRADLASFPQRGHYLKVDPQLVAKWHARFAELGPGLKVGISWRGASDHEEKYRRSIPLVDWEPLLSLAGVHFINLQYGAVAAEMAAVERRLGIEIHDWEDSDPRRDLDGLAAQMLAVDLLITIGNTNAHLAGSLGANVWTLLPHSPSWRWMDQREDSPWYPSMRLIRQSAEGDWRELVSRTRDAVVERVGKTGSPANGALPAGQSRPGISASPANAPAAHQSLKRRQVTITDNRWNLREATIPDAAARAMQYHKQGESHHAEGILREILRQAPKHADTLHRLGCLLRAGGRREEALPYLREAAAIAEARANFHFDLAVLLVELHQNQEAERELWRVVELDPNQGPAYVNLGVIYERLGKLDEALSICQRGLKLVPDSPQAHYNLANVYLHLGHVPEAISHYDQLLAINPEFSKARWNRGLAYLLTGDFARGWQGYEFREQAEQVQLDKFPIPLWDGSSLAGKTLLVHAEQGVGDEIMFNTCIPDVVAMAAKVHLTSDPRLVNLFARSFRDVTVHSVVRGPTFKWQPPEGIDVYTHAATLACRLRPDWSSFPKRARLLVPDPALVAKWRVRFSALGPGLKIGMSWRAGGISSEQRRRTSLLDHWQSLFRLPGCHFINLQYGDWSEDLAAAKTRWGVTIHHWDDADPVADLENFAAQVAALDAVVSVGNTTVHMAGALGIPTWAVLPRVPGWRYLLHQDQLPWYSSVRLRRQKQAGDWDEVYSRVAQELRELMGPGAIKPHRKKSGPARELLAAQSAEPPINVNEISADAPPARGTLPHSKIAEAFVGALKQHRVGRLAEAEQVYRQIIEIAPDHTDSLHLLGVIGHQTGRLTLAIDLISQAIQCDPNNSVYRYNLASALRDAGRADEAIEHLRRAVELNSHLAEAWLNLGTLLQAKSQYDEAIRSYERALAIRPDYPEAHNNIGSALRDLGRYEQAIECYRRAIELRPQYADAHLHLAGVLRELGRAEESMAEFDRGLELNPHNADAHVNRAMLRIQQRQFEAGWSEWQWRWKVRSGPKQRPFTQPEWDGSPLGGKHILVHMEQGVGDEIMLASCLPDVIAQARRTTIECDSRLVKLFERSFPQAVIVPRASYARADWLAEAGAIDCQIAAGSLTRFLRRRLEDFPRLPQLLVPDPGRVRYWRSELSKCGAGLKVGISWRGGFDNFEGRQRSTHLEQWLPIANSTGVQFVSLQYGDCRSELGAWPLPPRIPAFDLRQDLDELAALVAALDLVISVSNVTVHLSGAVGTPCWALLVRAPSWRWFNELEEAPWYRSVRLIRQGTDGRWESVMEATCQQLRKLAASRSARHGSQPHITFDTSATAPDGFTVA